MKWLGYLTNTVLATIFNGYVMTILWGWFVVEKFSLPTLNIPEALGILLIAKFSTIVVNLADMDVDDREVKSATLQWLLPLMALLMGWIYTLFM